ncbi:hypothetical protein SGRIM128S_07486 [Streptomyces griseomycini]
MTERLAATDQRPSTHPVAPDPEAVPDTASALLNFDGISYAKGASALRQLVAWLGEKDFLAGINTTSPGTSSPTRPSPTSSTTSPPPPTATSTPGPSSGFAPPASTPSPPTSTSPPRPPRPDSPGRSPWSATAAAPTASPSPPSTTPSTPRRAPGHLTPATASHSTSPATAPTLVRPGRRPALVVLNDGDLTYAKIRLDAASWETALGHLSAIPDALTRAVIWNAARDMVRDGELDAPIQSDATCAEAWGADFVKGHMVCAGEPATGSDEGTVSACNGDSGGPPGRRRPHRGRRLLGRGGLRRRGRVQATTLSKVSTYAGVTYPRVDDTDLSGDGRADLWLRRASDKVASPRTPRARLLGPLELPDVTSRPD